MTTAAQPAHLFASPVDAFRHGEYRAPIPDPEPVFTGRVSVDGSTGHRAEAGRYHLYLRAACPASHRLRILRELAGLDAAVSAGFVHGIRDARGWVFRPDTGPDAVNGFTAVREAYLTTDPAWHGDPAVPLLWDRRRRRVVSTDPAAIGVDLLTAFTDVGSPTQPIARGLYPPEFAADIEGFDRWVRDHLGRRVTRAVYSRPDAAAVRAALARLDALLAHRRWLCGDRLTDADVRVWVRLVRYDAGPNAHRAIGPRLDTYPDLWRWAQELYALRTFRRTTDFPAFTAPLADVPPWGAAEPSPRQLTSPTD